MFQEANASFYCCFVCIHVIIRFVGNGMRKIVEWMPKRGWNENPPPPTQQHLQQHTRRELKLKIESLMTQHKYFVYRVLLVANSFVSKIRDKTKLSFCVHIDSNQWETRFAHISIPFDDNNDNDDSNNKQTNNSCHVVSACATVQTNGQTFYTVHISISTIRFKYNL